MRTDSHLRVTSFALGSFKIERANSFLVDVEVVLCAGDTQISYQVVITDLRVCCTRTAACVLFGAPHAKLCHFLRAPFSTW